MTKTVGTSLEFAAFGSGSDAKVAELVLPGFFLSATMVFAGSSNTFSQEKQPRGRKVSFFFSFFFFFW